jgi:glycosyltransferase involved in cell wall biosynthesis
MIKILYIVSTLKRSGPVIVLLNIIKYLDRDRYTPIVLTLSPEPKESMKKYFENDLNTKVETLGIGRVQSLFVAKKRIRKFLSENSIDIVHTHGFRADALISKINGIPKVSTLHNYPFYDYPMTYGKVKGYLMAKIHLYFLRYINEPRVVSKSISEILINKNNYSIKYIRNGTETIENLDKNIAKKRIDIEKNKKVFISVGHLNKRKDPITIIKAFKKANLKNSELLFLGNGEMREECEKEIGDCKNIKLIGRVENVYEYLKMSDYFISASLAEGLPNTVLEAMACGLPCILSNIPPHLEIYEINNNASLIFKIKDIDTLSILIRDIQKREYNIMSNASKEIVNNHLSAEIMSKNYQNIYDKLLLQKSKL